jgi:NADP-dependent 3-hydroxy acid dehydrogenase YdfG
LVASNRWEVIATMRDQAKETELNKLTGAALLAFDITDPKQIENTVKQALKMREADVVFSNARLWPGGVPVEA